MAEANTVPSNSENVNREEFSERDATPGCGAEIRGENGEATVPEVSAHSVPQPQLSKNAQKRLAKQKFLEERKIARREHEKEMRKAKVALRKAEREREFAEMTPEERLEKEKEVRESRKDRFLVSGTRKERLAQALEANHNVVLDLDFGPMMRPREVKSLAQQVMYCYAANNRAEHSCRLTLTGCKGEVSEEMQKISGFENWRIHKSSESYLDVFAEQKGNLVYLTADSDNLIEDLESDKIYIIGGLVDRNRYKDVTLKKAREQGIAHGKLPIGQHMKLLSSQVLTVNQVMEILLRYLESRDWPKALLAAVPQRKRAADEMGAANPAEELAPQVDTDNEELSRDEGATLSPLECAPPFNNRGDEQPDSVALPVVANSEKEQKLQEGGEQSKTKIQLVGGI